MRDHTIYNAPFTALIEGYASIFDVADDNGDIVAPGAFSRNRSRRLSQPCDIKMLYQHKVETPIGRWISAYEDARGLFISGEIFLSSQTARDVYALLEGGAIDGLSIGFQTVKARKEGAQRRILEAALWEVSIVTFPMARGARITKIGPPKPARSHYRPLGADAALADTIRQAGDILTA